ncbi:uncharacterized protein LOC128550498 [Mercenaria mercenaria]|uniref:uncharacterized protein LOC128550498 n=1 Tax=Mercenaria mercenaria TaxID=6596 RepID=UPI00234F3175|nr:uncharacterized protein LOC128550498 [Mercenaria mercenaria]
MSPSTTVLVSEILPRGRDLFQVQTPDRVTAETVFLDDWNAVATEVNNMLHVLSKSTSWFQTISQWDFHSLFGAARRFLGRDGLHLNIEGTEKLANIIETAMESVPAVSVPTYSPSREPEATCIAPPGRPNQPSPSDHQQSHGWSKVHRIGRKSYSSRKTGRRSSSRRKSGEQASSGSVGGQSFLVERALENRRVYEAVRDLPSAPLSNGRYQAPAPASVRRSSTYLQSTSRRHGNGSSPRVTPSTSSSQRCRRKTLFNSDKFVLCENECMYYLNTDVSSNLVGGGVETPVFSSTDRVLSYGEASCILESNLPSSTTKDPPYKPKEGSVFLYCDSGDANKKDDWKADGYTWRHNGRKEYKVEGKIIERHFYKIRNNNVVSGDFQKHVFRFISDGYNGKTVLAYYGSSSAYQSLPHGNRKRNTRPFKRTKPSVVAEIKTKVTTKDNPNEVLEKMRSEKSPESKLRGVAAPRNLKQVQNLKQSVQNNKKLSHDAMFALHLLVTQLDGYIISIKTTPDLEVVVGNAELFQKLKN